MKTVGAITLGCKVNQYDTQAMLEIMERGGYCIVPFSEIADVYIINTCTVTNIADRKSRQMISRAHKRNSNAVICVCGCLAQKDREGLLSIPGVSFVIGSSDRENILDIIDKGKSGCFVGNIESEFDSLKITGSGGHIRANIKIQEGCENFCSYCIIPYVRGPERSRPADEILNEAERLSNAGISEIVLTGIHVSSYSSCGNDLGDLIKLLNGVGGIRRIRLGSLEQGIFTKDFCKKLASSEKLCPHFHISLQSGSDTVLRRMNRHYTAGQYADSIGYLRNYFKMPAVTTDIITGFPGEKEADFAETCRFVSEIGFSKIHVFPYSEREGTAAAEFDGKVPVDVRRDRAVRLIEQGKQKEYEYIDSFAGCTDYVLIEQPDNAGGMTGHTSRYVKVIVPDCLCRPGNYVKVIMDYRKDDCIIGRKTE